MSSGPLTNSSTLSTNGALGIPRGFVYLLVSIHLHTDRIRDVLSFRLCHGRQASRKAKCVADDQSLVIFKNSENQKSPPRPVATGLDIILLGPFLSPIPRQCVPLPSSAHSPPIPPRKPNFPSLKSSPPALSPV